jgi:hypothetical protein
MVVWSLVLDLVIAAIFLAGVAWWFDLFFVK